MSLCTVRLYQLGDAEAIHAAALESVAEIYPWMAWCRANYALAESRQWIRLQIEAARQKKAFELVIVGEGGRLLGGCGINQINSMHRFANLGYWVRTSATGRGVAPAAVQQAAAYAFRETDLNRLELVIAVANRRSQRVAEKVGATREGVLRSRLVLPSGPSDAVMYSLVRPA
jgi:RimJ/RimL family protein N-acetyltransferase